MGRSNIEFEAKVMRDLILRRKLMPCCITVNATQELANEYVRWLDDITNLDSTYPPSFTPIKEKYFYFLEKFKASYKEYNFPTDPNLYPTALFNLFPDINCP